ncbi:hypothetical protein COT94_00200 [Candidatus Falkowbacteria bacterium CG10_big_fil_rev_8_21_14_0_10_37_14]|uniref:Ribosomal RNA large subunit methyltransferase K/L-like methyltransferase domain-containing protein n=1 Tax=Candidatus Falkowbacteria bacterium CG10_big_fil_rev_8_21_14_0_10_37_14 TaxID=1974561 RepID=A0A2M6WUM0_9BACT|nr:hypothetical protein [Candidatus Falkowbacteria bacterium]PIT96487.1 MAG: hypothetical protein COT94_00200 [Candidatus Falkowbacteria bacterium CG10_big_fil_rev_8_21_14_0_10_37_14]
MKYFLIFGNHPELALAEIYSVLGDNTQYLSFVQGTLIFDTPALDASQLIKRLGGTVKIGQIAGTMQNLASEMPTTLASLLNQAILPFFGISLYGAKFNFLPIALELKKTLKIKGRAPRFVVGRELVLSSVIVEQNKLTRGGVEIVIIKDGVNYWYGRTLAVQPFKELSARDYGRPARDDASGMLPPKVALTLLNLAEALPAGEIYDPFCGSGTILSEAAMIGVPILLGSDISQRAVGDTTDNLTWLNKQTNGSEIEFEVIKSDARKLLSLWPGKTFRAIAFEGFLGPQRGKVDWRQTLPELAILYNEVLPLLHRRMEPGSRVVMALPYIPSIKQGLAIRYSGWKRPKLFPESLQLVSTPLLYGRAGQKVWREIIVLAK